MAKSRTGSFEQLIPLEVRSDVDRDLVEKPPGRSTYKEVFDHYGLSQYGYHIKSLERRGAYLRKIYEDRKVGLLVDVQYGREQAPDLRGLLIAKTFDAVARGDLSFTDLRNASTVELNVTKSNIADEKWKRACEAMDNAMAVASKEEDPVKAFAIVADTVKEVFGIGAPRSL